MASMVFSVTRGSRGPSTDLQPANYLVNGSGESGGKSDRLFNDMLKTLYKLRSVFVFDNLNDLATHFDHDRQRPTEGI